MLPGPHCQKSGFLYKCQASGEIPASRCKLFPNFVASLYPSCVCILYIFVDFKLFYFFCRFKYKLFKNNIKKDTMEVLKFEVVKQIILDH